MVLAAGGAGGRSGCWHVELAALLVLPRLACPTLELRLTTYFFGGMLPFALLFAPACFNPRQLDARAQDRRHDAPPTTADTDAPADRYSDPWARCRCPRVLRAQ